MRTHFHNENFDSVFLYYEVIPIITENLEKAEMTDEVGDRDGCT